MPQRQCPKQKEPTHDSKNIAPQAQDRCTPNEQCSIADAFYFLPQKDFDSGFVGFDKCLKNPYCFRDTPSVFFVKN